MTENARNTVRIKFWGLVQGVGFRPFAVKLANKLDVKGEIRNSGGSVDVVATGSPEQLSKFKQALYSEKPFAAEVVHIETEELPLSLFHDFNISVSDRGDDDPFFIPPDTCICSECLNELYNIQNHRYLYPFISCMCCGPRYSILECMPYDRCNTSMSDFTMCEFCYKEYINKDNRRFHAQTISCDDCGPSVMFIQFDSNEASGSKDNPSTYLDTAASMLKEGQIIALKGMGGFYYVCSPFIESAVFNLRKLKSREAKPFAVMFRDMNQLREYCKAENVEEALLCSPARPIVLLEKAANEFSEEVCKTSPFIGAFLPSLGLQYLLLDRCGPLIMTSANTTEMPITKDENEIQAVNNSLLKAMLSNGRNIITRLDDSIVRVIDESPQMIRRSKGYAPMPLKIRCQSSDEIVTDKDMVFAAGSHLKAAFCLTKGHFAYPSQYLGDMNSVESREIYRQSVSNFKNLLRVEPNLVVCDMHPNYFPTVYAREYSNGNSNIPLISVQHHHAHIASVIAEHGLSGKVLGVSMDGTGYGTDDNIWGCEFLLCEEESFFRAGHLEYISMIGGDSSMHECWKSAMCYINQYDLKHPLRHDHRYHLIEHAIGNGINTFKSCSMGRLFDAVAAMTGIGQTNRYEGECAILLESAAEEGLRKHYLPLPMEFSTGSSLLYSPGQLLDTISLAIAKGMPSESIALGFHNAVARMILHACTSINDLYSVDQIALSGGVFQNRLLIELVLKLLREKGFHVYRNTSVAPNDGGLCLGQAYLGMIHLSKSNHV